MDRSLLTELAPKRQASRFLGYNALFWLASAAFHGAVFLVSDTGWAGPVSWRKPIVFSLSFALMFWAFGWVLDRLPDRPVMSIRLAMLFAVSSTIELALIIGQRWRGQPSHFSSEGVDGVIFALMGLAVAVISISILVLFGWALRRPPTNRIDRLAIFGGLAMIVLGLGVGQWLISLGTSYVEQFDQVPTTLTYGNAGSPKFPHGLAFHGMQFFMIAAALLKRPEVEAAKKIGVMWIAVMGYFGVLVFSILQSFGGRAPLDIGVFSGGLLAASLASLVAAFVVMMSWNRGRNPLTLPSEATMTQ